MIQLICSENILLFNGAELPFEQIFHLLNLFGFLTLKNKILFYLFSFERLI